MKRFLLIAFALLIAACEGPVGPEGPPGPPGVPGLRGEQGNANVAQYTLEFNDDNVAFNDNVAKFTVSFPPITEEMATSGAVIGFIRFGNDNRWVGLPLTEGVDTNGDGIVDFNWEYTYNYGVGFFELQIRASGRTVASIGSGSLKVVLVAGEPGKRSIDLNFESYEEAAAALGLEP